MKDKLYKLMNWPDIESIVYSECSHPGDLLGAHSAGSHTLIQAYIPGAQNVELVLDQGHTYPMDLVDETGFFAVLINHSAASLPAYHYHYVDLSGNKYDRREAYGYPSCFTQEDLKQFKHGIHYSIYEKLGAHPMTLKGIRGTDFAVWAPNALRVSVVGDFNGWDGRVHQMNRLGESGIFELFIPDANPGDNYKFEIKLTGGLTYLKADPYCNQSQLRPNNASVIANINGFSWNDADYISKKADYTSVEDKAISIYELNLGGLHMKESDGFPNYRTIADDLIPYLKETGYTHLELTPIMEYPLDESQGYETIGYYAPTARYGSPKDFMYFVNTMHKAGIGVILDWVPTSFPKDDYGLASFDGTCLYEHLDPKKGRHPYLGTLMYNYGRPEVSNFLIANALFWVEKYHIDGLRIDSLGSILYLDYGREDGKWIPNMYGGNENLDAIEFLKHLNSMMNKRNPGTLMIAADDTTYPGVTKSVESDGLGFSLKWNNGFVKDYIEYISKDPYYRSHMHNSLTFSMVYQYSEHFLTPYSYSQVGGSNALCELMPGDEMQKMAGLRLSIAYQFMHPGKKLLNIDPGTGIRMKRLVSDLNTLYRTNPALYELDDVPDGFQWVNAVDAKDCIVSFIRQDKSQKNLLFVVANFSGIDTEVTAGVPFAGKYKEIFSSDKSEYGGTDYVNKRVKTTKSVVCDGYNDSLTFKLAALSLSVFLYTPEITTKQVAKKKK